MYPAEKLTPILNGSYRKFKTLNFQYDVIVGITMVNNVPKSNKYSTSLLEAFFVIILRIGVNKYSSIAAYKYQNWVPDMFPFIKLISAFIINLKS